MDSPSDRVLDFILGTAKKQARVLFPENITNIFGKTYRVFL